MRTPARLHVNGKWLDQNLTGTQRYAHEVVREIVAADVIDLDLHVPSGATVPDWLQESARVRVRRASVRGVVFEQLYLPVASIGGYLLNFAGPAPLLKRRQLVTMHDATPFRFPRTFTKAFVAFYWVAYTLLGRVAHQLVTVSQFSATELNDVLHIPLRRFLIAGCSADALAKVTPARPSLAVKEPFYLVVGTLAVHKNLTAPVEAMAESGRTVVVVGASGNRQAFSESAIPRGTVIAGRVTDGELAWLYQHAEALVFPSRYEGFGMPPLEAQTLGCPVITSSAASLPEIVGDAGIYFDPEDPATLIAALTTFESDDALRNDLRERGFANATRYTWRRSAVAILGALNVPIPDPGVVGPGV